MPICLFLLILTTTTVLIIFLLFIAPGYHSSQNELGAMDGACEPYFFFNYRMEYGMPLEQPAVPLYNYV